MADVPNVPEVPDMPDQRLASLVPDGAPKSSRTLRLLGWGLALAWAAFLFFQSSSADAGGLLSIFPEVPDKVAHAVAYAVLAAFLTLGSGRPVLAVALAVAYGASDEIHQAFVPGRTPEVLDLVADAVGAVVGSAVAVWGSRLLWRNRGSGALGRG